MKTLLLVDGSSYLYRAFHALPDLRSHDHAPTGAIYGVINMLRRLAKDIPADYSACVFDAKGKTFRDAWYPAYKAHRPPMPADLSAQIEPLHQIVRALGWPLLMIDGVEADDVIGTLAEQATQQDIQTIVSTGDKDIAQLVNTNVQLINTMTDEQLDQAGVTAKFGVPPERIVDYLALIGDSADNIPGVTKVGPKTAVKWLRQYQTLENLIAHNHEIGGVVGENLRQARDWLPQAQRLLTIKRDVPLPLAVTDLTPVSVDKTTLAEWFDRLGFSRWLHELRDAPSQDTPPPRHYETITTQAQLTHWLEHLKQATLSALDTETTSLDPMSARLVGLSFAVSAHQAAYLPLAHRCPGTPVQLEITDVLARLQPWLEDPAQQKLGQNLKYDMHVLANHGISLKGMAHDTLLQSFVLESHKPHDMDAMALRHLGIKTITYAEVAGKGAKQISFDQVPLEVAAEYAAEDADITLQLHQVLYPAIEIEEKLDFIYRQIEVPLAAVLFTMERNGVLLDTQLLEAQSRELGQKMLVLEQDAHILAGQPFNLNSPKQIQEILFNHQQLPVIKKTPGGVPSTDEEVLQQLAVNYPLPKLLLDYRSLAKLKSTYTDKLPRMINQHTGRVHTNYNQAGAVTGRLASTDPNLQNIPVRTAEGRKIREAFIAEPAHHLVSADYSQIELRIMAHLSGDTGLLRAFTAGEDVHRATAAEVFGVPLDAVNTDQRRTAKIINFGLIYGMSAFGLANQLGIERAAAQAYMERYFARYPGVADYMQRTREHAKQHGCVETAFGRRLYLPEIRGGNNARRQGAERAAINAPMQGTAADLIKLAMIAVQHWLTQKSLAARLIMQVHDELILEVPDTELATVRHNLPVLMCGVAQLRVPLVAEVGVGLNWEQAH